MLLLRHDTSDFDLAPMTTFPVLPSEREKDEHGNEKNRGRKDESKVSVDPQGEETSKTEKDCPHRIFEGIFTTDQESSIILCIPQSRVSTPTSEAVIHLNEPIADNSRKSSTRGLASVSNSQSFSGSGASVSYSLNSKICGNDTGKSTNLLRKLLGGADLETVRNCSGLAVATGSSGLASGLLQNLIPPAGLTLRPQLPKPFSLTDPAALAPLSRRSSSFSGASRRYRRPHHPDPHHHQADELVCYNRGQKEKAMAEQQSQQQQTQCSESSDGDKCSLTAKYHRPHSSVLENRLSHLAPEFESISSYPSPTTSSSRLSPPLASFAFGLNSSSSATGCTTGLNSISDTHISRGPYKIDSSDSASVGLAQTDSNTSALISEALSCGYIKDPYSLPFTRCSTNTTTSFTGINTTENCLSAALLTEEMEAERCPSSSSSSTFAAISEPIEGNFISRLLDDCCSNSNSIDCHGSINSTRPSKITAISSDFTSSCRPTTESMVLGTETPSRCMSSALGLYNIWRNCISSVGIHSDAIGKEQASELPEEREMRKEITIEEERVCTEEGFLGADDEPMTQIGLSGQPCLESSRILPVSPKDLIHPNGLVTVAATTGLPKANITDGPFDLSAKLPLMGMQIIENHLILITLILMFF
ncbi:unnamed protein product [Protopolystoma xenopodis]|uniref:Uncharacterized protein n=1 Tax=Protopolystoma xenopodis TaxID=117903 RepID=A0A3S4ZWE4_9PLAT|nr:unnamed protein product [Protopolystoma xenopodis]